MILGKHDNGYTYLRVRCDYTGDDRIFFDSLIMRVDGVKEVKKYERAHDQIRERSITEIIGNIEGGKRTDIRGYSIGRNANQHVGEDGYAERMVEDQVVRESFSSDTERAVEQDGRDKSNVKASLADDGIPDLFEAWDEAWTQS